MFKSICKSIINALAVICETTVKHNLIVICAHYNPPKHYDGDAKPSILIERSDNILYDSDVLKMGFG